MQYFFDLFFVWYSRVYLILCNYILLCIIGNIMYSYNSSVFIIIIKTHGIIHVIFYNKCLFFLYKIYFVFILLWTLVHGFENGYG